MLSITFRSSVSGVQQATAALPVQQTLTHPILDNAEPARTRARTCLKEEVWAQGETSNIETSAVSEAKHLHCVCTKRWHTQQERVRMARLVPVFPLTSLSLFSL